MHKPNMGPVLGSSMPEYLRVGKNSRDFNFYPSTA